MVVPTHDTREITLRCLASVEREARATRDVDVVLVDDGSRDGTAEAVRARHPALRVIVAAEARGFTVSANEGLAAARGELLLLLNSDAELLDGVLAPMAAAFADDPRLGALGAVLLNPDGSPQWSGGREPTRLWLFLLASGLPSLLGRLPGYRRLRPLDGDARPRADWVTGAALAIRREAWAAVGPLDPEYRFYAQDLDFCLRLEDAGWKIAIVPGFRVMHLGGATIGQRAGATGKSAHPGLLWSDLLTWARKRHGAAWSRSARRWMRLGGALRVVARGLRAPFVRREDRAGWDRDTTAFRLALGALAGEGEKEA